MFAVYSLDLVASGFALSHRHQSPRLETPDESSESRLFLLQYALDKAMTWEELEARHSLSEALLEESFHCTFKGDNISANDIRKRQIASLQTVVIVLRSGACSSGLPKERRR